MEVFDYMLGVEQGKKSAPQPSGTIEITENGTGIDVSQYAKADVNVQGGASLNIAYGQTAPEDTSKLWIKENEPTNLEFGYDLENGVESIQTLTALLPDKAEEMGCSCVANKIYLFGGFINNGSNSKKIYKYDILNKNCSTLSAELPIAQGNLSYSVATVGTKIYLFGMKTEGTTYDKVLEFDTNTETITTLTTTLPKSLSGITSVAVGTNIYLFGGSNTAIMKFDTVNKELTTLISVLPQALTMMTGILVGTKIYLFGGIQGSSTYKNIIFEFDTNTETITTLTTTLPEPLFTTGVAVGTDIYLFGGKSTGQTRKNNILKFDTNTETITTLTTTLPEPMYSITSVAVGTDIYLFGGNSESESLGRIANIQKFTVTFPLTNGNIFVQEDFFKNRFDILSSPTKVSIGVRDVFIGNEDDEAEKAEAYLYDEKAEEWMLI